MLSQQIKERRIAEEHLRASQQSLRALAVTFSRCARRNGAHRPGDPRPVGSADRTEDGCRLDHESIARGLKALREKTHSMSGLIDATMESVHEIMTRLRRGIGPARTRGSDRLAGGRVSASQRHPLQRVPSAEDLLLDRDRSTAVFRIFQELLTNVARHAGATRTMWRCGPTPTSWCSPSRITAAALTPRWLTAPSRSLMGVRERVLPFGGRVDIEGVRGEGSRVTVALPKI